MKAIKTCRILKKYSDGEINLTLIELQICKSRIKKESRKSFYFFSKYVLGFDKLTDQTHKKWGDDIQKSLYNTNRIMRLKPRATYKTTLYGISLILWIWACISPEIKIFYTSANSILLQEVSDQIISVLDNPENIYNIVFGIKKDKDVKNTNDIINVIGRTGKGFSLILKSAGTSTVGIHPNLIIVDDPCDNNDRESITIRKKKEKWLDTLTPLLVSYKGQDILLETMIFIGTRWHVNDLSSYIFKKNEIEKKWDIEIESIFDESRKSNYPEFITDEKILDIKNSISDVFFACQYENNPLPEGLQIFSLKKLHFKRPEQIDITEGQIACFFDPSTGKKHADYPAVIWTLHKNNKLDIIDNVDEKIEIAQLLHLIVSKNIEYNVNYMLFENNSTLLLGKNLRELHEKMRHNIKIDEVRHNTNKDERIISIQPDLYSGFCSFMSDYKVRYPELMNQLIYYPAYGHDDFPDVLEMAISHYRKPKFQYKSYQGIT